MKNPREELALTSDEFCPADLSVPMHVTLQVADELRRPDPAARFLVAYETAEDFPRQCVELWLDTYADAVAAFDDRVKELNAHAARLLSYDPSEGGHELPPMSFPFAPRDTRTCPFCGSADVQVGVQALLEGHVVLTPAPDGSVRAEVYGLGLGRVARWADLNQSELHYCRECTAEYDANDVALVAEHGREAVR